MHEYIAQLRASGGPAGGLLSQTSNPTQKHQPNRPAHKNSDTPGAPSAAAKALTLTELASLASAAKPVGQFGLQLTMVGRSASSDLYSLATAYGQSVGVIAQTAKGPVLGFNVGLVTVGLRSFSSQGFTTIQVTTHKLGDGLKFRY
jgi:hypothetical protein